MSLYPRVVPFGEAALLVELATEPELGANARVHALARALRERPPAGLRTLIPGAVSLLVELDPLDASIASVATLLEQQLRQLEATPAPAGGRLRTLPTVYGGAFGPDLEDVATRLQMRPEDVIRRHTACEQRVYMLGFSPGFPYLGDLPPELALPRRDRPRQRVPLGSVAIAGRQTGVYSRETPGGWHLLGRTPVLLFDEHRDPPAYLGPGDRVRFVAIEASAWDRHTGAPADW